MKNHYSTGFPMHWYYRSKKKKDGYLLSVLISLRSDMETIQQYKKKKKKKKKKQAAHSLTLNILQKSYLLVSFLGYSMKIEKN